ncbi:hypothetical protein EMCG_04849 [[Emmonsia] crescens]|uniref:Aminoglycoside phosphotransferase domain-containing protein n=1 Tax=[Emmonsia] crescens TaxID=73230 RepID=A0A0G2HS11_9EURO|nr:hypothetical protein EMCG_04849 [Emmonsia crescens UAMH 3008]
MEAEFDEKLLQTFDDEILIHYIESSPTSKESGAVFFLSPNLVAKECGFIREDGIRAMKLAHELRVRVPDIKRVIEWDKERYIIMSRVNGPNLNDCWHQLDLITTIKLAFQLRSFIHRMRSKTSLTAGGLVTGIARSLWIDDYYKLPPHASTECVAAFFNFWGNFVPDNCWIQAKSWSPIFFPPDEPLVFTHQDLAPRNLLVDDTNQLWLVDWEFSGWFPTYLEYVSMHNFWIPRHWTWWDKLKWKVFSWISTGRFKAQNVALRRARDLFMENYGSRESEVMIEGAEWDDLSQRRPGR